MERTILRAGEGMVYTNGTDGGKTVYLAVDEDATNWYEIPEDEFIRAFESGVPYGQISDGEALEILMGGGTDETE